MFLSQNSKDNIKISKNINFLNHPYKFLVLYTILTSKSALFSKHLLFKKWSAESVTLNYL